MEKLSQYFWAFVEQAPSLIAMLAGLVFALTRWKRFPRVALVVALSLALLIVHAIVFVFIYDLVPPIFLKPALAQSTERYESTRRIVFLVLGLIYNFLLAVGFGILLAGVFMQRKQTSQPASFKQG
jgi:MFS superfamily sulfate permease-like transporter